MRAMIAVSALCVLASVGWSAATAEQRAAKLCDDALAALRQTTPGPLADVLSKQASSFTAAPAGAPLVHQNRAGLLKLDRWTEQPLLTDAATVAKLEVSDHFYAMAVRADVTDGPRAFLLDGVCVAEGEALKWISLAVAPRPADPDSADCKAAGLAAAKAFDVWREAMVKADPATAFGAAPDDPICMAGVGPDYGLYLFGNLPDLQTVMGQIAAAGGWDIAVTDEPTVTACPPVALARLDWRMTVGGFQPVDAEVFAQLIEDDHGWRTVALCALPPVQK